VVVLRLSNILSLALNWHLIENVMMKDVIAENIYSCVLGHFIRRCYILCHLSIFFNYLLLVLFFLGVFNYSLTGFVEHLFYFLFHLLLNTHSDMFDEHFCSLSARELS
jgi:hypothetical protein